MSRGSKTKPGRHFFFSSTIWTRSRKNILCECFLTGIPRCLGTESRVESFCAWVNASHERHHLLGTGYVRLYFKTQIQLILSLEHPRHYNVATQAIELRQLFLESRTPCNFSGWLGEIRGTRPVRLIKRKWLNRWEDCKRQHLILWIQALICLTFAEERQQHVRIWDATREGEGRCEDERKAGCR